MFEHNLRFDQGYANSGSYLKGMQTAIKFLEDKFAVADNPPELTEEEEKEASIENA